MIKEKLKELSSKLNIKKGDLSIIVFSIIATVTLFACYYLWGNYLIATIGIVDLVLFGLIALIFMALAGFMVFKSLFLIAAELSLLIFLSQSYCATDRTAGGDKALAVLLIIGVIYVIVSFLNHLYNSIKNYKNKKGESSIKELGLYSIILFGFIALFIWLIYLVIYPIISNLCIYK